MTLVYVSWGTTYLAIKEGVRWFPPALFGGVRITLAGAILACFVALRPRGSPAIPLRLDSPLSWRDMLWTCVGSLFLFVGGNGLITAGERTVDSGVASVLTATTPLWMALLEAVVPWGERLALRGWAGLALGLAGVLVLLAPKLGQPAELLHDPGPLLVLASSLSWSVGSFVLRYQRWTRSHLAAAATQMLIGGTALTMVGLAIGEAAQVTPACLTVRGLFAFAYLLVVGSLIGFVSYNWLLGHVSAAMAGTYAYVNPAVAIVVGWLIGGEPLTGHVLLGMAVILGGVALVRDATSEPAAPRAPGGDKEQA
jgi:drug/metabolite transporter (DMT)-like permease